MTDPHSQKILILDFGSQYTQLIARRVREAGVYCELHSWDSPLEEIRQFAPRGIILSGGPESVTLAETPRAPKEIFDMKIPILGICYGQQTMAAQLGGAVEAGDKREFGYARVRMHGHSKLFRDLRDEKEASGAEWLHVWMSHGDRVTQLPPGFKVIAETPAAPFAGIADEARGFYGIQFHPEVTHTTQGRAILQRFVHDICGCGSLWTPGNIIESMIQSVRAQVGRDEVVLGLSGGVDSSVVAALLHRAIGQQLTCIFVDNGLLRLNEGDQVMETFARHMGVKVIRVDAENRFLSALKGVADPEKKRKIIGGIFIEVFEEEAAKIKNARWLAQGTIYPDVIESAAAKTRKAHVIKSHHNVGGLPEKMNIKLLEPLRELFKDEVRRIGEELGLPHQMIYRHPFPGPGLGVRILGEVKKEYADLLRQADAIYLEELYRHNLYDKISQAFAVFLPVKSVAVLGDARAYDYVIALRAVETVDFMTANWAPIPYEVLGIISNRIINEVRGISRVVYDISGKPPATIEWE
ncbi:MAG: glutamine-hydrolyzing GMP synthase [Candidatus Muproteobacteria bacterium RIFCSPHIGHO2_12_FULL_60_33]|uniref:GMP synthase [glutamine-hydrolyzing] n=1 Tax=Candidatus Muproteobacteria bacterium RIFCSPLOWO2_01_FULL_60_18 TaxID=1817768 RepID=A0A1F6U107_9PROT|nr:MAG: glutamine-hydrolyzing GMP synthase [Candidatus Muproteobacteria bacterium RIFCSPLOWO2_01_FULL_60_18]OGI52135.1 MAG: glutamine-hydrolyzing GMP synthase [Candidatus Muproteobacteria bacterium RIFCSPHIGHO2_01_60_12]OGI54013.1 MAG: glutamine-hydrolyzing GMP synthase [Candidatus Muproteobacteria bacterium RIFCSPHIGHO2_02_FULL_60_13]OGI55612.1 MAG: glutamine-hydrolyzing GMP synthase [Candidatus Muproteobacteria bacterium RIFCSPHIGHO2_12_FULL_60_33]OGI59798.1 MAG: glutamine-hydrolyzing GMP syn